MTYSRDWGQHWEVCCDGDYKRIIERNNVILEMNRYATMHLTLARLLILMSWQERAYTQSIVRCADNCGARVSICCVQLFAQLRLKYPTCIILYLTHLLYCISMYHALYLVHARRDLYMRRGRDWRHVIVWVTRFQGISIYAAFP